MRTHYTSPTAATAPLTWFAELWFARQSGDREREDVARQQLRRHGVDVLIDASRTAVSRSRKPAQPQGAE